MKIAVVHCQVIALQWLSMVVKIIGPLSTTVQFLSF